MINPTQNLIKIKKTFVLVIRTIDARVSSFILQLRSTNLANNLQTVGLKPFVPNFEASSHVTLVLGLKTYLKACQKQKIVHTIIVTSPFTSTIPLSTAMRFFQSFVLLNLVPSSSHKWLKLNS